MKYTQTFSMYLSMFVYLLAYAFNSYAQPPASVDVSISHLQDEWARIKYQVADKEQQIKEIHELDEEAATVVDEYPNRAEPKIWQGIILSTEAGMERGLSALGKLKKARDLFLASIEEDDKALHGSAYTSLASLYYQVPGWPISFGSDKKAKQYFEKALAINPDGIDSNFFFGDFLLHKEQYEEAKIYFEKALQAPPRAGRKLADEGRRQEIRAALTSVESKIQN